jgi:glucose/arabinose dehydrogenase
MRRSFGLTAVLAIAAAAIGFSSSSATVSAATVPPGFTDVGVAAAVQPTAIEWLPDDRLVVLQKADGVLVGPVDGPFATALVLPGVCSQKERGYLGFTHDPAFLANGFVYLYYTREAAGAPNGCVNRVSRFTMTGASIDPTTEVVLLDNISSLGANHNGGDLDIGADGYLYVSVGDAGADPRVDSPSVTNDAAQDLSLLNGKILRITLDGRPAPGNPLSGPGTVPCATRGNTPATPTTQCQEIYAWGLRNPFRIAFDRDAGSNRFFINDVGQRTREEIDLGQPGANYGFPIREGICPFETEPPCTAAPSQFTDPVVDYSHAEVGSVITGGAFVPDGLWPIEFDGAYVFADAGAQKIWMMDAIGNVDFGAPFASVVGYLTDMTFGFEPDGRMALFYTLISGEVRKIVPTAAPTPVTPTELRIEPVTPVRAYDTDAGIGVAPGAVFNGSTRYVELPAPTEARAALVNITLADTAGPGFVRAWAGRSARPATSNVNADSTGTFAANATIVPLDADGGFVLESTATARIVVDVMGWLLETPGTATAGRLVTVPPERLVDTRLPAGTPIGDASFNPWARGGDDIVVQATGSTWLPADGTADAVLVSIGLIPGSGGSFAGGYPTGAVWGGTSNVNATVGDVRANLALIPLGPTGSFSLRTVNAPDVVVDVLGYVTSSAAPSSASGLYSAVEPVRLVDTRIGLGFDLLGSGEISTVDVDGALPVGAGAVVQNVAVTQTAGAGFLRAFPGTAPAADTSTVNHTAGGQTRAALAVTPLPSDGVDGFQSSSGTHLVVDVIGVFSR